MNFTDSIKRNVHDSEANEYNPTSIQLHLITGRKAMFYLEDAVKASEICEELDGHVFTKGSLIIEGLDTVAAFSGSALVGITVLTSGLPKSFEDREAMMRTVVTQLSEPSFQQRKDFCKDKVQGERSCVVSELEFVTGEHLYLEFNEIAVGDMGERSVLTNLFTRPSIFCRTLEGGFGVFNTAHIVSWSHHPKLDVPTNAWYAESLPSSKDEDAPVCLLSSGQYENEYEPQSEVNSRPLSPFDRKNHLSSGELEFLNLVAYGDNRGS